MAALLGLFFLVLLILPYQAWWRAKRTGYFVSNQRAFVVVAIGSAEIFSYPQGYFASNHRALVVLASGSGEIFSYETAALDKIILHEMADGSGEILLEYHRYFVEDRSTSSDGGFSSNSVRRVEKVVGFLELQQVDPPKRALESLLGRELLAERVTTHSLNYEHPL
ncbi:MAG: hypothetical protein EXR98_09265 [Gemmataceae bacterium]|nr:hypothetical protein [Gemmataceae bacterium]